MSLLSGRSEKTTSGIGLYHPPYFDAESLFLFTAALHILGYLVYQLPVDSPVFAFHLTTGVLALQMYASCFLSSLQEVQLISLCLDNRHFYPLSHIPS